MVKIRQLQRSEIHLLKDFPPEDWNLDLPALLSLHFDNSYLYPVAAETENKIVGCGIAYCFGKTGWLGNIIVIPDFRRHGIGRSLTQHLMEYLKKRGCNTQILTASEMGEGIYQKLGFKTSSMYAFYRRESPVAIQNIVNIRNIKPEDILTVKKLDREVTGEERFEFLEKYLSTAWVYSDKTSSGISGFYLPDFSSGLIIAKNNKSGLELVKLRLNHGRTTVVVPAANTPAREFLLAQDFKEYRTAPRMVLGEEVLWQPAKIYNRGSGYCG